MNKLLPCLLAVALVFSLAACDCKDKGGGDGYDAFVKAMTDIKEAGDAKHRGCGYGEQL